MRGVALLAVGKLREKYLADACAEYQKRLGAYCRLSIVEVPECRLPQAPSPGDIARALEHEGRGLLSRIPPGSEVVALCVEGEMLSSEAFSSTLDSWAQRGRGAVALIIGGSHGLSPEVKARAALRLSLSRMTFPHQLARVMALEQLYRAFSIAAGGKYHK